MKYPFGQARDLHRQHVHPRVLYGPDDVARIRRSTRRGAGAKIIAAIRKRVDPLIQAASGGDDITELLADPSGRSVISGDLIGCAHDMAMIATIDGRDDALRAVRAILRALPGVIEKDKGDLLVHGRITPCLLAFDLCHASIPAEERQRFADWVLRTQVIAIADARRPRFFMQSGMNLAFGKVISAVIAVLTMRDEPGVPEVDPLLPELCKFLEASGNTAVCPDGYPEEDTGYGTDFTMLLFRVGEALRRSGEFDLFGRCPHLLKFGRAMTHFVEPWGESLVATGDAGDHFHGRHQVLPRMGQLTKDMTAVWLSGVLRRESVAVEIAQSRESFPGYQTPADALALVYLDDMSRPRSPGKAKLPTPFIDRRRGIVSFRSGWRPNDTLLVVDGSQRSSSAQGHFHASCGHFNLSALGEYFAIDTGRYNMDQDQHNVTLINGSSGHSSDGNWVQSYQHGRLVDYRPGEMCDYVSVDSSHQHNCYWAFRHAILVKGPRVPAYAWVVDDINKANDWAEYWFAINTCPENRIETHPSRATITGCRHGNHLDVHAVIPDAKYYSKPHTVAFDQDEKLCGSWRYIGDIRAAADRINPPRDQVHHSVYVRPRLLVKVAGYNGRFMTFMLPRTYGSQPARVEAIPSIGNVLAARIQYRDTEDTVVWAYDHRLLEAADVVGRGAWGVVRRDRKSGRVLAWHVHEGASLMVKGRKLM